MEVSVPGSYVSNKELECAEGYVDAQQYDTLPAA